MTPARPLRCTNPLAAPYTWAFYRGDDPSETVTAELVQMVRAAPSDQAIRQQEVKAVLDRAEHGALAEPDDVKGIALDEDLREIRLHFPGSEWRLYFAEPPTEPHLLLALHCHQKRTTGTARLIRTDQNQHIALARRRYRLGRASHWGL